MVDTARVSSPVGRTAQNEFREQSISPAAELVTWEHSGHDRTPAAEARGMVDLPDDIVATFTVAATIGADLGAGKGLSPAVRLLADDPARRRAVLTTFRGTTVYIAAAPEALETFAAAVKVLGTNAPPPPGVCAIEGFDGTELHTTRELWVMFGGVAALSAWVSGFVERGTRRH